MNEITRVVSQREALHKYQNIRHLDNGMCEVTVYLKPNGKEDPSSWNHTYRNSLKKTIINNQKKLKSRKPRSKWYFGMSRWNPLSWLLWIVYLPFRLFWKILKGIGLGFIGDWIGGDVSDMVSEGADFLSDSFDVTSLFDGFEGFDDFEDIDDVMDLFEEEDDDDDDDIDIAEFRKKLLGGKKKKRNKKSRK